MELALKHHRKMLDEKKIPKMVYKYSAINSNLLKSLINSELWFATPISFNDPFDCQLNDKTVWDSISIRNYLNYLKVVGNSDLDIEDIIEQYYLDNNSFRHFFTKYFKRILSNIGVCCFTTSPKIFLMWSHYANSHKGLCLKFDITKDENLFLTALPVKYSIDYPSFDYLKERNKLAERMLLTKSKVWKYEKEIRVITGKSGPQLFKKDCLKEIIFGYKTTELEIKEIKKIVSNSGYKNIRFSKVDLVPNKFKIKLVRI
ncbi:MAG: DUF2971 domain-containing protein [Paludibacter sp.]|nr:DUF2971 domain-containing protein [Paludibacter sp.]